MSISASERFWAKVDQSGECWNWVACRLPKGYGRFGMHGGRVVLAHRFAYAEANGEIPDGMHIDHLCFTPSCVRPSHLVAVTPKQNIENRGHLNRNNTTGYRGVKRSRGGWAARVKHHRQDIHVGTFESPEEAAEAARLKRLELFTHSQLDARSATTRGVK